LFINENRENFTQILEILDTLGITIKTYDIYAVKDFLKEKINNNIKIIVDADELMVDIYEVLGDSLVLDSNADYGKRIVKLKYRKSIRNEISARGMRECQIRDGAAVVRYLSWLEQQLSLGTSINE